MNKDLLKKIFLPLIVLVIMIQAWSMTAKFISGFPTPSDTYIYGFEVNNSKVSKEELMKVNKWTVATKQPTYNCPYGPAGCADSKFVTK